MKTEKRLLGRRLAKRLSPSSHSSRSHLIEVIDVPHTTDFALMYLPFEGLYAEAIRRAGVFLDIPRRTG